VPENDETPHEGGVSSTATGIRSLVTVPCSRAVSLVQAVSGPASRPSLTAKARAHCPAIVVPHWNCGWPYRRRSTLPDAGGGAGSRCSSHHRTRSRLAASSGDTGSPGRAPSSGASRESEPSAALPPSSCILVPPCASSCDSFAQPDPYPFSEAEHARGVDLEGPPLPASGRDSSRPEKPGSRHRAHRRPCELEDTHRRPISEAERLGRCPVYRDSCRGALSSGPSIPFGEERVTHNLPAARGREAGPPRKPGRREGL